MRDWKMEIVRFQEEDAISTSGNGSNTFDPSLPEVNIDDEP